MANKIDITIKAKDEASGVIDDINDSFGGLGEGAEEAEITTSDALGDMFDNAMNTFVGINQGIELVMKAFDALKLAYEGTVGKVLDIAGEVEELVRVSGDAPENMSALRLEAEKADVPFDDLYKAMENLNKNGVPPTLENLGKIAEEYGKLEDPIERARYLTEQFGEYGDDIAPMLEDIADGVTAVADSPLIFTEEELQAVKDHEEAVSSLKLAWEGFVITIGQSVIPTLTEVFNQVSDSSTISILREQLNDVAQAARDAGKITKEEYNAIMLEAYDRSKTTGEAIDFLGSTIDDLSTDLNAEKEATEAALQAHDDLVMSIFNGTDSWSNFQQAMEEAGLSTGMLTEEIYNQEKAAVEAADSINNTKIVPKMVEIDVNDGPSKEKIEQLRQMGIEDKSFEVKAKLDTSAIDNWIPPTKTGTITYTPVGHGTVAAGGAIHAAASGLAASLSSYWVGERGPEPFFPAMDGRIVSNTQAMAAL
ncbi:MAG: hypothetical protein WC910_11665, partial [Bacteroidales bacterium]